MILFVRLLRLGRIYRPKYDILVYKNYKPVGRLGVLHSFKDLKILRRKVKVLRLRFDTILFWKKQGLILPYWLSTIIEPLFISQKYHGIKINNKQAASHTLMLKHKTVVPMQPFNFICGKTHARFTLKSKYIKNKIR